MADLDFSQILNDAIILLIKKRVISSPFQVVIIKYDIKTDENAYYLFAHDLSSSYVFLYHPLITQNKLNEGIESLEVHPELYKPAAAKQDEIEKLVVLYKLLKSKKFLNPISKTILGKCLKNHKNTGYENLTYHPDMVNSKKKGLDWVEGCALERILFYVAKFNFYVNSFILKKDNNIYFIGCFVDKETQVKRLINYIEVIYNKYHLPTSIDTIIGDDISKKFELLNHESYSQLINLRQTTIDEVLRKKINKILEYINDSDKINNIITYSKILTLFIDIKKSPEDIDILIKKFKE